MENRSDLEGVVFLQIDFQTGWSEGSHGSGTVESHRTVAAESEDDEGSEDGFHETSFFYCRERAKAVLIFDQ